MYRALVLLTCLLALSLSGCDARRRGSDGVRGGDGTPDAGMVTADGGPLVDPGVDAGGGPVDPPRPPGGRQPGAACNCDSECGGTVGNPGICVQGICMVRASGDCAAAGSTGECPAGSRCWGLDGVAGGLCWPDCDAHTCDGTCDSDGSCAPNESSTCDAACSEICTDTGGGGGGGGGGSGGCPPNSHMEGDGCVCDDGYTVNDDLTACVPECTRDSDCSSGDVCTGGRCETPPCTATSCPAGTTCSPSGDCVIDIGTPPPGSPPSTCRAGSGSVPDWRCTGGATFCGQIVPFDPVTGPGYENYPLNGETASNQYRSYVRRDVMMLVKYAAAMVACQAGGWPGNGGLVGLGDMSESDGAIPGTSIGSPGHPAGTHVDGHDMDIGYFQTGTPDNRLRPICSHTSGSADQYHCTSAPTMLDPWRTALFIGHLHATPQLRVIGVDGRAGPLVESAMTQLCSRGWVTGAACSSVRLAYETTDMGRGWFRFHHHHLHVSVSSP